MPAEVAYHRVDLESSTDSEDLLLPPRSASRVQGRRSCIAPTLVCATLALVAFASRGQVFSFPLAHLRAAIGAADDAAAGDATHLSQECTDGYANVIRSMEQAFAAYEKACNSSIPGALDSDACTEASAVAVEASEKSGHLVAGRCATQGLMQCNVTEVVAGADVSFTLCLPHVCKPENVALDGLDEVENSGQCNDSDCSIRVACVGHPAITKDVVVNSSQEASSTAAAGVSTKKHVSQACEGESKKVFTDMIAVHTARGAACNSSIPGALDSAACHAAAAAAEEANKKSESLAEGRCAAEGLMQCNVTQPAWSTPVTVCMPKICEPENLALDTMDQVKGALEGSDQCSSGDCTVRVACAGHPEVTHVLGDVVVDVSQEASTIAMTDVGADVAIHTSQETTNTTVDVPTTQQNNMSQACDADMEKVGSEIGQALRAWGKACNSSTPGALDSTACHDAAAAAALANKKSENLAEGHCAAEGLMQCNVTQIASGRGIPVTLCLAPVCNPENFALETVDKIKGSANCGLGCTVRVACAGHPAITKDVAITS